MPAFTEELTALVTRLMHESGQPEGFDAAAWVTQWLDTPLPALGGQTPRAVAVTDEGRHLVKTLVQRMQSGAYS